jgi:hypothetical protein
MTVANRKDVRAAFATLLAPYLSAAEEISPGQPATLDGTSPIVVLSSNGTGRAGSEGTKFSTFGGGSIPVFYIDVYTFVLATSAVDDTMDTIEQQVAQAIAYNQTHALWTAISYRERSKAQFLDTTDGKQYKFEIIYLSFTGRS